MEQMIIPCSYRFVDDHQKASAMQEKLKKQFRLWIDAFQRIVTIPAS